MAEKLVLVPEAILRSAERVQHHQQPVEKKLGDLDKAIDDILQRDIPDDEKVKRYFQVLDRYLEYSKQLQIPKPFPIQITRDKNQVLLADNIPSTSTSDSTEEILRDLPKSAREKGERLLQHLHRFSDVKWDQQGRLILKDNAVEGSNITDLIYHAVKQGRAHQEEEPPGLPGITFFEA